MFGIDVATLTSLTKILFDGLAVLIIIFLYIKSTNEREKERKEDRKRYNDIVNDIVNGVHNAHLTPSESKGIIKIEKQINEKLNKILQETEASRVSIVRYHNGSKDMTGKSFLKMSMTNEVINVGVASMMPNFKDIFRSFLTYWCHEIERNGVCVIQDTDNMQNEDIGLYQYFKTINVQAEYGVALQDGYGNVIGFLSVAFLDKDKFKIEKIEKSLDKNLPQIETLISINDGGGENELQ